MESSEGTHVVQAEGVPIFVDRPRTAIGLQGDHVTAYGLFKEYIRQVSEKDSTNALIEIIETLKLLRKALDKYVYAFSEEMDEVVEKELEKQEREISEAIQQLISEAYGIGKNVITNDEINITINSLQGTKLQDKILIGLTGYNQSRFDKLQSQADNIFLSIRNRLKYVSFPREGSESPPPGEPARVTKAIELLREYNKNPIQIKGNKDLDKIVDAVKDLSWYPKVSENKLIDLQKSKKEWNEIKKRKRYLAGTKPRTNDLDILYHVTALHIDTIASCFPVLRESQYYDRFIQGFVEKVAVDWGMERSDDFLGAVKALMTSEKRLYIKEQEEIEKEIAAVLPENIPVKPKEVIFSRRGKASSTSQVDVPKQTSRRRITRAASKKEKKEAMKTEMEGEKQEKSKGPWTKRKKPHQ